MEGNSLSGSNTSFQGLTRSCSPQTTGSPKFPRRRGSEGWGSLPAAKLTWDPLERQKKKNLRDRAVITLRNKEGLERH